MSGVDKLLADLRDMAEETGERVSDRFSFETRARLARMLEDAAAVAIRHTAGEDTTTARLALEVSVNALPREERAVVLQEGRDLAFRAVMRVVLRLLAG